MKQKDNFQDIELLKQKYEFDEEKKLFTIRLKYSNASELIDEKISTPEKVIFTDEISDTILQYLDDIPKGYKSNIEFDITDYEGYSPKAFMDAFKYLLECDRMRFRKEKHKKNVMIAGLLSAGLFFLLIMILTLAFTFINETVDEILTAVIEIASWVFIWEAIDLIFLSPTDTFKKGVVFFSKIESVSFSEGDCVNVISCGIEELHNELKGA